MKYKAAIFDMDGTVLDTVGDLTDAVNYTMGKLGLKNDFTPEDTKLFFGSGVTVGLTRALAVINGIASGYDLLLAGTENDNISPKTDWELLKKAEAVYKPYYATHNNIKTGEYPGIKKLLTDLKKAGVKTAVVSNKPHDSVISLSNELFDGLFDLCLGEQPGMMRKPAPDMIFHTLNKLDTANKDAVYIGDSEIDLLTAKNSGLSCIAVTWGFRNREFLVKHGAGLLADSSEEILKLI